MSSPEPRGATPADRESLRACVGRVFRPTLMDEYPQLFHDGNLENCRIIEIDGEVVSHVGMTVQDAAIVGCRVRVACIGGVGTLPEHRGKGYAGACLHDAIRLSIEKGCDFMMISGDRSLYRRAGTRKVGLDLDVTMSAEQAEAIGSGDVTVREASEADLPTIAALHRAEPLHWKRPPDVWERAFDCKWVMNRFSEFWIVERNGHPYAYFIVQKVGEGESARVSEIAGDRQRLLYGIATVARERGWSSATWHLAGTDRIGRAVADEAGLASNTAHTAGTIIVVNFPQLMDRVRPYLADFIGTETAEALEFAADGEGYTVRLGGETFALPNRGAAAHFVFGTNEEREVPPPSDGRIGEVYDAAFPIPVLWYGINYV